MSPEALYMQMGQLIAEMPNFVISRQLTPEKQLWLGRAVALVEAGGSTLDAIELMDAAKRLDNAHDGLRRHHSDRIAQLLFRALARAELKAPAAAQGAFVPAGNVLDAFAMVAKILGETKGDVLIVDRYANDKVLTDFAVLAPENVTMRLLTTEQYKASLQPAAEHWRRQYRQNRPLEIRVASPKQLHDRLIVVDNKTAWTLGQSLKDLAVTSPTTIIRTPPDLATAKIEAYADLWTAATPL